MQAVKARLTGTERSLGKPCGRVAAWYRHNGLANRQLALDLKRLAGWSGARVFANGFWVHGRGPSANLVGNLQLVSNIEATRSVQAYDLWLEQRLFDERLSIRIGQRAPMKR